MSKVKIISGIHEGKTGELIGMFYEANTYLVETEDGTVLHVKPREVRKEE